MSLQGKVRGGRKREFKSEALYRRHLWEQAKAGFLNSSNGNWIRCRTPVSKQERSVLAGYHFVGSAAGKHK